MTLPSIPIESPAVTTPFRDILWKLCSREDLTRDEAREAFLHVMSGTASESQIAGLLVGLAAKGTTAEELIGAAAVMREKAVPIGSDPSAEVILDTCGTGGEATHAPVMVTLNVPSRTRKSDVALPIAG